MAMSNDSRRRTGGKPYGVRLNDDERDRLVPKHSTSSYEIPDDVEDEPSGVHRRVKALSTSFKILDGKVELLSERVSGMDDKLDILVDAQRNAAAIATAHIVADVELGKIRAKTEIEDVLDRKKSNRAILVKILSAIVGSAGMVEIMHRLIGC